MSNIFCLTCFIMSWIFIFLENISSWVFIHRTTSKVYDKPPLSPWYYQVIYWASATDLTWLSRNKPFYIEAHWGSHRPLLVELDCRRPCVHLLGQLWSSEWSLIGSAFFHKSVHFCLCLFCFLKKSRLPHGMPHSDVSGVLEAWWPYVLLQMGLESLFWGSSREAKLCIYPRPKNGPPLEEKVVLLNQQHSFGRNARGAVREGGNTFLAKSQITLISKSTLVLN